VAVTASSVAPRTRQVAWIQRPALDIAVACAWVPFTLAAWRLQHDAHALGLVLEATLLLSLSHQPLTLALVYGDPEQRRLRRRIFAWSPLVFLAAVAIGGIVSPVLVAAVAGLWNAAHTLLQRYGLTRIYGRRVGQDDGGLEKAMLVSWLVLALVWAAADPATPHRLDLVALGTVNERAVSLLVTLRPVARVLAGAAALAVVSLGIAWVRAERRRAVVNPAKWLYLASTASLFALTLVQPIAGLVGYVGAHAVEYLVTVDHHVGRRYTGPSAEPGGVVGAAVRSPIGRHGVVGLYLVTWATAFVLFRSHFSATVVTTAFLTVGGLHVFYDGFIWKLRRPSVAKGFALGAPPAGA
jgi:hypothetical protein